MAVQEKLASLLASSDKLVHPLAEVRRRAVQSLDFKLKHQLLVPEELAQERAVLKNLLGCLQHDDNGTLTDAAVLMLLSKVASLHAAARQLLHMGAEPLLAHLRQSRPAELQPVIDVALGAILAAPKLTGSLPATPAAYSSTVTPNHAFTKDATARRADRTEARTQLGGAPGAVAVAQPSAAPSPAVTTLQSRDAPRPAFTYSPPRPQHSRATPAVSEMAYTRASAQGRSAPHGGWDESPRDWLLHPVALGQADDQALFELSLRIKHLNDPRIALPALMHLYSASLVDLPVEAVAARHDIVAHLLAAVTSPGARHDVAALAAQCLQRLVVLVKRSLLLATDPMYNSPCVARKGVPGEGEGPTDAGQSPDVRPALHASESPSRVVDGREQPAGQAQLTLLPQPLPAGSGGSRPVGRSAQAKLSSGPGGEHINVSHLAFLIGAQVFHAMRDPQRLFALAPLAEELVPLLVLGRDGQILAVTDRDRATWAQIFQALSKSLVANLSIARAESPPIVQAFMGDGLAGPLPPVLNAPAAAILALSARLLSALPRGLWVPEVVPPALADTLAACARDGVLAALLPGLRDAVMPLLAALRPDVPALLDVASAGEAAVQAGVELVQQLPALRRGEVRPQLWLEQLERALPALHLPDQGALLEAVVQGLALVCSGRAGSGGYVALRPGQRPDAADGLPVDGEALPHAPSRRLFEAPAADRPLLFGVDGARRAAGDAEGSAGAGGGPGSAGGAGGAVVEWARQAEGLFLALLSHEFAAVALACYSLLEGLVQDAKAQAEHPLPQLLTRPAVLEHLVVLGLADERTRRQVARILLNLMHSATAQECLLPWSDWVSLYEPDPQVGALAAALEAGVRSAKQQRPPAACSWQQLHATVMGLYSADADRRRAAAGELADVLGAAGMPVAAGEVHIADPFKVCLDDGARDGLVVPAANPRLARTFRPADVSNLLAILANAALALELRRSAAEQMLALAAEERLREVLEEEASLWTITCIAALRDPSSGAALTASQEGALAAQGLAPPTPDLLSTLDVQLPVAAINLLFVLAAHSPRVRAWLVAEPTSSSPAPAGAGAPSSAQVGSSGTGGGADLLRGGVLPMVFHGMVTVRRAVARLLAALSFGREADRWSGWARLAVGAGSHGAGPAAGATGGRQQGAGGGTGGTGSAGDVLVLPQPFRRRYCFPCGAKWVNLPAVTGSGKTQHVLEGKPRLQDLVSEQRQLVVLLVQERLALRAAGGDPLRLLDLMNDRPDLLSGLAPAVLHSLAASIRSVTPGWQVPRCLEAVASATSHTDCTEAVRGLQQACCTRQGVEALAAADWQVHLEALLATSPASNEDRALWVELMEPLRRVLVAGTLNQPQLLQLARYLQRSTPAVLSAPDAWADPPSVPLALAGSEALPDHSHLHTRLACTQAVLAALVELVRSASARLSLQYAVRTLLALSPTQLLQTLAAAYIGNDSANYGCRALAVQLLLEIAALLDAAQAAGVAQVSSLEAGLEGALLACLRGLLGNISGGFAACAAGAQQLTSGGAVAARPVVDRSSERQAGGFVGKCAVRLAMHCLLRLTVLLPAADWMEVWLQLSGSFWVSRLLRDRDAVLRSLAAEVLARLMQPGADSMHAMVAQGWPDASKTMAKAALDQSNCYALRTAALRVLCSCMAQETADGSAEQAAPAALRASGELPRRQLFSSLTGLPPAALLLQHGALWAQLPAMLREPDAPAPFLAAALSLLLQGVLLDGEGTAGLLRQPGLLDRLLQMLGEGGGAAQRGARSSAVAPPAPTAGRQAADATSGGDRAAVLELLGWTGRGTASQLEPAPAQLAPQGGIGGGAKQDSSQPGAGTAGLDGWAGATAALQLEQCAGLEAVVAGQPHVTATARRFQDPSRPLHLLCALNCAGRVAQLLAHTQQEPPLLPLPLLGHSTADAAAALLEAFARVAEGAAALCEASELPSAATAPLRAARIEVARHTAVAGNAVLQLLTDEEAHEALTFLDAVLLPAPGPLLVQCAEVLQAASSPGPLRMAVVCLLATLLARHETARRLLCFELTDDEYRVTSNGVELGACLCAALTDMLQNGDALAFGTPGLAAADATPQPRAARVGPRASTTSLHGDAASVAAAPHRAAASPGPNGEGDGTPVQVLGSDSLCVVVALRNLLAHSRGAKAAALRTGFHRTLLRNCSKAVAAAAALQQQKQASVPGPGAGAGHARRGAACRDQRHAPGGGLKGQAALRRSGVTAEAQQSVAAADTLATPRTQEPDPAASPAAQSAHGHERAPPDQRTATVRRIAEEKAVAALSLLKHMALGSASARQLLVRDGIVALLRSLWPAAVASQASTSGPLFHELLGCLTNLLPDCAEARARVALEGAGGGQEAAGAQGTLLGCLLSSLFGPSRLEAPTFSLIVGVLLQLSAPEDGAQLLLKAPFLTMCQKALLDMANAAGGGGGGGGSAGLRLGRDPTRQAALLQVLTNVAAWPEGQRALLRSGAAPGLLELVMRLVQPASDGALAPDSSSGAAQPRPQPQQPPGLVLRNAALALLRNLCFAPEAKAHLLAHPGVLPGLVAAAEAVADNPEGAAFAASGLWALVHQGEKIKSALRRVPSAVQRLVTAHAASRFQEARAEAHAKADVTQAQAVDGKPPVIPSKQRLHFLRLASVQLSGLLEALQATGGSAQPSHSGQPDWVTARDQGGQPARVGPWRRDGWEG